MVHLQTHELCVALVPVYEAGTDIGDEKKKGIWYKMGTFWDLLGLSVTILEAAVGMAVKTRWDLEGRI